MSKILFLKPISVGKKKRIGRKSDGGYVIYEPALEEVNCLLTYGVGFDFTFEEDFVNLTNKKVLMFDPTMFGKYLFNFGQFSRLLYGLKLKKIFKYCQFVYYCYNEKKRLKEKNIFFINEGIANKNHMQSITKLDYFFRYVLGEPLKLTKTAIFDSLQNHVQRFDLKENKILLKIDIEGGEYSVFLDELFYKNYDNIIQILVEFHDLESRLFDLKKIIEKLSERYFLVHIHANNYGELFSIDDLSNHLFPQTIEVTFVRKDKLDEKDRLQYEINYPIDGLDFPNNPDKKDYDIEFKV